MCNKVLGILFIQLMMMCLTVDSYCWMEAIPPGGDACMYKGWKFEFGAEFDSPAPHCEHCSCSPDGLGCCGYGKNAGTFSIPGCRQVDDESTCDIKFVDINDESQPCNAWKK